MSPLYRFGDQAPIFGSTIIANLIGSFGLLSRNVGGRIAVLFYQRARGLVGQRFIVGIINGAHRRRGTVRIAMSNPAAASRQDEPAKYAWEIVGTAYDANPARPDAEYLPITGRLPLDKSRHVRAKIARLRDLAERLAADRR